MCIVALAWRAHPRWQLVLIGNRDEYHARPAAAMARWDDRPGLIAGRDLQSGGTWLGADEQGRAAVITNLRGFGDPLPDRASRGALVTDLLTGSGTYADPHAAALDDFNPFNLLLADRDRLVFLTNRPEPQRSLLAPGLYGLSNGPLDQPWPKTLALKEAMLQWLVAGATDPENLFEALRRETLPATGIAPATPSDAPLEPPLSPHLHPQPRLWHTLQQRRRHRPGRRRPGAGTPLRCARPGHRRQPHPLPLAEILIWTI